MDIQIRDNAWGRVAIAAGKVEISDKAGGLRALHVQMYDAAKSEKECAVIQEQALAEVKRLTALPKEKTLEERIEALETKLKGKVN